MPRHINLLDPPQKQRWPFTTALQMGAPIVLVLLTMSVWAVAVKLQSAKVKQGLTEIETQMRPVSEQLTQLQTSMGIDQVNVTLQERLERAQAQLQARQRIQTALQRGDLGSSQGFSEIMRAFARQTVAGVWLTGLKVDNGGNDITLSGRALNAEALASLVRQLRAEPVLKGRVIATLRVAPVPPPLKTEGNDASAPLVSAAPPTPQIYEFLLSSVISTPESPAAGVAPAPAGNAALATVRNAFENLTSPRGLK